VSAVGIALALEEKEAPRLPSRVVAVPIEKLLDAAEIAVPMGAWISPTEPSTIGCS
jgi:hypothetical protein